MHLLGDVASASEPHAIKLMKKTSASQIIGKQYDAHNNVANLMTQWKRFYGRNKISK